MDMEKVGSQTLFQKTFFAVTRKLKLSGSTRYISYVESIMKNYFYDKSYSVLLV